MPNNPDANENEIDLIELAGEFWQGRYIIFSIAMVMLLAGILYQSLTPTQYGVKSQITAKIHTFGNDWCFEDLACWTQPFASSLGEGWQVSPTGSVSLVIKSPLSEAAYADQLAEAVSKTNQSALNNAKLDMKVVEQFEPEDLIWGETIVVREFNTARTIELIESGLDSLTFSKPVITELAKPKLVVPGSLLLGLLWGLAVVFVRNRIRNRKVLAGQKTAV